MRLPWLKARRLQRLSSIVLTVCCLAIAVTVTHQLVSFAAGTGAYRSTTEFRDANKLVRGSCRGASCGRGDKLVRWQAVQDTGDWAPPLQDAKVRTTRATRLPDATARTTRATRLPDAFRTTRATRLPDAKVKTTRATRLPGAGGRKTHVPELFRLKEQLRKDPSQELVKTLVAVAGRKSVQLQPAQLHGTWQLQASAAENRWWIPGDASKQILGIYAGRVGQMLGMQLISEPVITILPDLRAQCTVWLGWGRGKDKLTLDSRIELDKENKLRQTAVSLSSEVLSFSIAPILPVRELEVAYVDRELLVLRDQHGEPDILWRRRSLEYSEPEVVFPEVDLDAFDQATKRQIQHLIGRVADLEAEVAGMSNDTSRAQASSQAAGESEVMSELLIMKESLKRELTLSQRLQADLESRIRAEAAQSQQQKQLEKTGRIRAEAAQSQQQKQLENAALSLRMENAASENAAFAEFRLEHAALSLRMDALQSGSERNFTAALATVQEQLAMENAAVSLRMDAMESGSDRILTAALARVHEQLAMENAAVSLRMDALESWSERNLTAALAPVHKQLAMLQERSRDDAQLLTKLPEAISCLEILRLQTSRLAEEQAAANETIQCIVTTLNAVQNQNVKLEYQLDALSSYDAELTILLNQLERNSTSSEDEVVQRLDGLQLQIEEQTRTLIHRMNALESYDAELSIRLSELSEEGVTPTQVIDVQSEHSAVRLDALESYDAELTMKLNELESSGQTQEEQVMERLDMADKLFEGYLRRTSSELVNVEGRLDKLEQSKSEFDEYRKLNAEPQAAVERLQVAMDEVRAESSQQSSQLTRRMEAQTLAFSSRMDALSASAELDPLDSLRDSIQAAMDEVREESSQQSSQLTRQMEAQTLAFSSQMDALSSSAELDPLDSLKDSVMGRLEKVEHTASQLYGLKASVHNETAVLRVKLSELEARVMFESAVPDEPVADDSGKARNSTSTLTSSLRRILPGKWR